MFEPLKITVHVNSHVSVTYVRWVLINNANCLIVWPNGEYHLPDADITIKYQHQFFLSISRAWVRYPVWQHTFVSLSAFSRRAVASFWRKYVHEVLVNRFGGLSLPWKSVVRLTDRPDMPLDVDRGRKTKCNIFYRLTTLKYNLLIYFRLFVFLQEKKSPLLTSKQSATALIKLNHMYHRLVLSENLNIARLYI